MTAEDRERVETASNMLDNTASLLIVLGRSALERGETGFSSGLAEVAELIGFISGDLDKLATRPGDGA